MMLLSVLHLHAATMLVGASAPAQLLTGPAQTAVGRRQAQSAAPCEVFLSALSSNLAASIDPPVVQHNLARAQTLLTALSQIDWALRGNESSCPVDKLRCDSFGGEGADVTCQSYGEKGCVWNVYDPAHPEYGGYCSAEVRVQ